MQNGEEAKVEALKIRPPEIKLAIPDNLKKQLVDDNDFIMAQQKVLEPPFEMPPTYSVERVRPADRILVKGNLLFVCFSPICMHAGRGCEFFLSRLVSSTEREGVRT